jgi:NAD/NADP transhydrogenase beta subunit
MFVMSLKGLQEKNLRRANWYGIFGMTLAIFMTFFEEEFHWIDLLRLLIIMLPAGALTITFSKKVRIYLIKTGIIN